MLFDGEDAHATCRCAERRVGFVFQHYALFRHMTVVENIAFGLRSGRARSRPAGRARSAERVASCSTWSSSTASASATRPALGRPAPARRAGPRARRSSRGCCCSTSRSARSTPRCARELRRWLRELHEPTGQTTVFVTHDQEEALELADRVAVLQPRPHRAGRHADEVYDRPPSPFVYDFLGRANAFDCAIERGRARLGDKEFPVNGLADGPAIAFVRPHDVVLCLPDNAEPSEDAKLPDAATVRLVTALGPKAWVELSYGSQVVAAEITRDALAKLGMRPGSRCTLQLRLPCFFARR